MPQAFQTANTFSLQMNDQFAYQHKQTLLVNFSPDTKLAKIYCSYLLRPLTHVPGNTFYTISIEILNLLWTLLKFKVYFVCIFLRLVSLHTFFFWWSAISNIIPIYK